MPFAIRALPVVLGVALLAGCSPLQSSSPLGTGASSTAPSPSSSAPATGDVSAQFAKVTRAVRDRKGVVGVAVVDRTTGELYLNDQAHERVRSASIVKVAIAAYYLQPGGPSADYATLSAMITRSDNASAYSLFDGVGESAIKQLSKWDTRAQYSPWWGHTKVTAAGQAKYLAALANGEVLPDRPTRMLLSLMRQVDPHQRWGLSEGVPGKQRLEVPVKNGWYAWGDLGTSSINCLALLPHGGQAERLAVAVTTSFPSVLGLGYGRSTCRQVGNALTASP